MVGCGSSSSSNDNGGGIVSASQCGYAQVYSADLRQCLQSCPNNPSMGLNPANGQCVPGISTGTNPTNPYNYYGTAGGTWSGRIQITNSGLYQQFLQEYGFVCNQNTINWIGNFNYGYQNCSNWSSNANLILSLASGVLPSAGFATLSVQTNFSYGYYGAQIPITINGQFQPINNNTGFQLLSYGFAGSYSYNASVSVEVQGVPTANSLPVYLSYRGGQFARASVTRY